MKLETDTDVELLRKYVLYLEVPNLSKNKLTQK